jgi:CAAX protease family protein
VTPHDPPVESQAEQVPPPTSHRPQPFWSYEDLIFFIALAFPSLFVSVIAVRAIAGASTLSKPFQGLLAQLAWYLMVFGSLYGLLRVRYGQPFWRSLGWVVPFRGVALSFFGGPALALAVGYVGYLLRTPEVKMPFGQMMQDRPTMMLFAIFVVVLGPLCEELAFRGFLMPLLMRSFGAAAGILITGAIFGCVHGYEYEWSWRHILLISLAGSTFGWVRYRTGSTAAATFMHSTFNLTQFAAFLAQGRTA